MVIENRIRAAHCAVLAVSASVSLAGILRAQAVPAAKNAPKMVPVTPKTAPASTQKAAANAKKPAAAPKKPVAAPQKPAGPRTGEQVFLQACASCHGDKGQGGKGYKSPLVGEQSIGELARFIAETMPPEPAPKLPEEEARRVAEYIHGAFYSPIAQERNRPARVELSRLTVGQYRNAVTDLIGSFRRAEAPEAKRGLSGKYFKSRQGNEVVLERVDSEIKFDFGDKGALAQQDDPYQFMMHWQGSLVAPDSGDYEFILRTEHTAALWVNDQKQPLVDARIKSGNANEYRAPLRLLGGRRYPLRLEFYKGTNNVENLKKLKLKPPQSATLALEWKLPHRAAEAIPERSLLPTSSPQKFVLNTPFPPDDRSIGYERGNSVSKEWDEATTEGALETAAYVLENLTELSGVKTDAPDRSVKLREFCRKFVARAFRRPLADETTQFFVERQFAAAPDPENAVKRVIVLTLKSPRFLYRELAAEPVATVSTAAPDAYAVASRLSFALWDSLPDEELLKATAAGQLATREQVQKQAERMANDARAWAKMRAFLLQWLKVDQYPDLAKDKKHFPNFDEHVASDLRTSLELSLENVVWSEKSDFRELMLSDKVWLNGRLAKIYGENLPENAPFQPVAMDEGKRSGVLTHPYILASFAYLDTTSPIHRGVLIARNLLGRALQPPPEAFTPLAAELHPNLTTRQRVALQTKPSACASCHNMINPLGFSLEQFDATGELRTDENGLPVDASGSYLARTGQQVKFAGARDLATFLAGSDEVYAALVEKLFQHVVKQPIRAFGPRTLSNLQESFRANNFNMRRQMIDTAVLAAQENPQNIPTTPPSTTPATPLQASGHRGIPQT